MLSAYVENETHTHVTQQENQPFVLFNKIINKKWEFEEFGDHFWLCIYTLSSK